MEEEKPSSLLSKRYKPFRGSCTIESDNKNKKMIITTDGDEDMQKARDLLGNGWAYSYTAIENDLYDELKADWNKIFHLLLLKKIDGNRAMTEMMKSINSRFDKDKDYII